MKENHMKIKVNKEDKKQRIIDKKFKKDMKESSNNNCFQEN